MFKATTKLNKALAGTRISDKSFPNFKLFEIIKGDEDYDTTGKVGFLVKDIIVWVNGAGWDNKGAVGDAVVRFLDPSETVELRNG